MKITKLLNLSTPDSADVLPIVDLDGGIGGIPKTKKVTVENLLSSIPVGLQLPTTTKTTAASGDYFIGIDANGQLYKITKANLLAGLSGDSNGNTNNNGSTGTTTTGDDLEMRTIISRDTNWVLSTRGSSNGERSATTWTSLNTSETNTGTLKIGYITTKTKLHALFAGGGSTNGNLKLVKIRKKSDDSLLLDSDLATIMGANDDNLKFCTINTLGFENTEIYLELTDNDSGSGWSWFAFCPDVFVE